MSICANLNVGLLFPFRNPPAWRKPFADFYAEQLAQTRVAEDLGYDEIWLTEHHFAEDGYSPEVLPIASAIASITKRIRIGTYLVLRALRFGLRARKCAGGMRGLRRQSEDPRHPPRRGYRGDSRGMDQGRFFIRGTALQGEERSPDAASRAVAASSDMDRRGRAESD